MPTQKAGIFTLAQFAKTPEEKEWFYKKFKLGVINDKDEYGSGLLHYARKEILIPDITKL